MTLRRCLGCTALYPPDLHACPQCASHAGDSVEDGEEYPAPTDAAQSHTATDPGKPRRAKPRKRAAE